MASSWLPFLFLASLLPFFTGSNARRLTLHNRCKQTIWPGTQSNAGQPLLIHGGLQLRPNEQAAVVAPSFWSGRFWARTGCNFNRQGRQGNCTTGDCGGLLQCNGAGGTPPATLAEFTIGSGGSDGSDDFYDVSLVDGFNLPVSIMPSGGTGDCQPVNCSSNVNTRCPERLRVVGPGGDTVACKSACLAMNEPRFCCTGAYSSPASCRPSNYSEVFKRACPTAYSYPYDDATSIFTCFGADDYSIIFC